MAAEEEAERLAHRIHHGWKAPHLLPFRDVAQHVAREEGADEDEAEEEVVEAASGNAETATRTTMSVNSMVLGRYRLT